MKALHETTCLVVDDSAVIRKVARRIIETLGIRVAEAEDGEAALRICADAMPDVILLDWNMPNMDGYAFLQALRKAEGGARSEGPVLHHRERRRGHRAGAACRGPTSTS